MKKNSVLKLAVVALVGLGAVGCQTIGTNKYGCSGLPDGVVCKSPSQIYDLTNGDVEGVYQTPTATTEKDEGMFKSSKQAEKQQVDSHDHQHHVEASPFSKPAYKAHSNPIPVLEQPTVLRIWIAPWVDDNETLNYPSYKFTEITPRKWNFGGNPQFRNVLPVTAPHNDADFKSPSVEEAPKADRSLNKTSTAGVSEQGLARQNEMASQMGIDSFSNEQTEQGLPKPKE